MSTVENYKLILVGTDGSSLAGPTVERAAALAKANGGELVIVCAYTELLARDDARVSVETAVAAGTATEGQVPGRESSKKALEEAQAIAADFGVPVAAALLVDGEPAAALLAAAKEYEVDALVVGAIRDTSIAGRLLGTVATEVVRKAHRDVLIVRPPAGLPEPNRPEDVKVN